MLNGSHAYSQTETSVPRNLSETEQADLPNITQQISGELGVSGGQTPKPTPSQVHTLINTQLKGT